ncbi:MAG TPA: N-acetyltransferase [Acidobacteriaceae bacterium]|nr:N-acetyltransferase [Acidobacteriaceae bacterium]
MAFTLRPVDHDDFPRLFALDQACFAPGIAWSKAELQYFLKYPGNVGVLAQDGTGNIAGFAIAGKQHRSGAVVGRLITIDVDPGLRRQGVGHLLIEETERQLGAAGATAVLLEVAVDNATAQGFYERHGYVRTGRIRGYYMGRIDALVMEKQLERSRKSPDGKTSRSG